MQFKFLAVAVLLVLGTQAHAGLIVSVVSGDPSTGPFTKITPPVADLSNFNGIEFKDGAGEALNPLLGGSTDPGFQVIGDNWWNPNTYPIFTTGLPSNSDRIIIDFRNAGYDVFGFSFQIGANKPATGWVKAVWGPRLSERVNGIPISPSNSPGIQVASAGDSCTAIKKIIVEPPFTWGIFNMGVDTVGNNCAQVPEPGSISLLGLGLLGLGAMQLMSRRRLRVTA